MGNRDGQAGCAGRIRHRWRPALRIRGRGVLAACVRGRSRRKSGWARSSYKSLAPAPPWRVRKACGLDRRGRAHHETGLVSARPPLGSATYRFGKQRAPPFVAERVISVLAGNDTASGKAGPRPVVGPDVLSAGIKDARFRTTIKDASSVRLHLSQSLPYIFSFSVFISHVRFVCCAFFVQSLIARANRNPAQASSSLGPASWRSPLCSAIAFVAGLGGGAASFAAPEQRQVGRHVQGFFFLGLAGVAGGVSEVGGTERCVFCCGGERTRGG